MTTTATAPRTYTLPDSIEVALRAAEAAHSGLLAVLRDIDAITR